MSGALRASIILFTDHFKIEETLQQKWKTFQWPFLL